MRACRMSLPIVALVLFAQSSRGAEPVALWEFAPYRVRLQVSVTGAGARDSTIAADVMTHFESAAAIEFGPAWIAEGRTQTPEGLPLDKSFSTDLTAVDRRWRIEVRELDLRTQQPGPTVAHADVAPELLASQVWRSVRAAFRPLTLVDEVEGDKVRLRVRAAGLVESDEHPIRPRVGQALRPWLRAESRQGEARIAAVEWTWLVVQASSGTTAQAQSFSGYRTPLSGRARGQVQTLALVTHPTADSTPLMLVTPRDGKALAGYEVLEQSLSPGAITPLGMSDWQGMIRLRPEGDALRWLVVRHGGEILARVPFLPGAERRLRLELPDDQRRLEAEGLTIGLQEQVVDLVARRQTLLAQSREELSAGKFDEAEQGLKRLRQLPPVEALRAEIRLQRQRLRTDDARLQAKITRLFDDSEQVLNAYLDPRELDQFERELRVQRKAK